MNHYNKLIALSCLILFSVASHGKAEEEYCNKVKETQSDAVHADYIELHQMAIDVATNLCLNMKRGYLNAKYSVNYLRRNTGELELMQVFEQKFKEAFPEALFPGSNEFAASWPNPNNNTPIQQNNFPVFTAEPSARTDSHGNTVTTYSVNDRNGVKDFEYKDNNVAQTAHCKEKKGVSCEVILQSLGLAIKPYNYYVDAYVTDSIRTEINTSLSNWDKYNKEAPIIGLPSRIVTTIFYRDHFYSDKTPWPGPPPTQIRALEVSLVYDHMPSADDGNESKPGAAIEWLGFNDWNNGTLPWGAGLASVYVDREGAKALGHGVIFHVYNEFSFGVVRRGNDNTLFFNLSFTDWFGENRDKLSDFRKSTKPKWLAWFD